MARNVQVLERRIEREQDSWLCKDFHPTAAQVAHFLNSAAIITPFELHDFYDVGPCIVTGTAEFRGIPASWEMRIGGTGPIIFWDEFVFLVGDENQRYDPGDDQ
jgi:hypothetical protein